MVTMHEQVLMGARLMRWLAPAFRALVVHTGGGDHQGQQPALAVDGQGPAAVRDLLPAW
jgi:hypothetical protein